MRMLWTKLKVIPNIFSTLWYYATVSFEPWDERDKR